MEPTLFSRLDPSLLRQMFLHTDFDIVRNLCAADPNARKSLCENPVYWKQLIHNYLTKNEETTRRLLSLMERSDPFTVIENKLSEVADYFSFWMNPNTTATDVAERGLPETPEYEQAVEHIRRLAVKLYLTSDKDEIERVDKIKGSFSNSYFDRSIWFRLFADNPEQEEMVTFLKYDKAIRNYLDKEQRYITFTNIAAFINELPKELERQVSKLLVMNLLFDNHLEALEFIYRNFAYAVRNSGIWKRIVEYIVDNASDEEFRVMLERYFVSRPLNIIDPIGSVIAKTLAPEEFDKYLKIRKERYRLSREAQERSRRSPSPRREDPDDPGGPMFQWENYLV